MSRSPQDRQSTPGDGNDPIVQAIAQWSHERPDLDTTPMAIFGRISRIFALQRRAQAEAHDSFGLTYAAFDVLANLRRSGAPHRKTASSLADSSMISTGGQTFRMDGLETNGFIRRVRDDRDRRVVYAELTAEGRDVIDRAMTVHVELEHHLLAGLSERERQTLIKLLMKLERSLVDRPTAPEAE